MADTHDNLDATESAIKMFNQRGVKHVLHAGDLVSPFVAAKFSELEADLHYVWGNNEGDRGHIRKNFEKIGVQPLGDFASIEFNGQDIVLLHGTSEEIVEALAESGTYDVVVRGHTHQASIRENPLVINPGEVCGWLSGKQTVALLDLDALKAKIVKI